MVIVLSENRDENGYSCTMQVEKVQAWALKRPTGTIQIIVATNARPLGKSLGKCYQNIEQARTKFKSSEVRSMLDYLESV